MPRQPPIDILPIQIREDVTVQIAGIPHDLTREEPRRSPASCWHWRPNAGFRCGDEG
jgi:hypothetical protein